MHNDVRINNNKSNINFLKIIICYYFTSISNNSHIVIATYNNKDIFLLKILQLK